MGRKIKYRAWKKNESPEMINNVDFIDWKNGVIGFDYPLSEWTSREDEESLNNIILMQYTGIKDINGVEIYEGDVIAEIVGPDEKDIIVEVVYYDGCFMGKEKGYEPEYPIKEFLNGKIIGNIYENPELFEEDAE